MRTEVTAKKLKGLKSRVRKSSVTARLNPCPFKTCYVPLQNATCPFKTLRAFSSPIAAND